MSALDIALVVASLAAFVGGYRSGLIVRALSWLGTALGLLVVARNLSAVRSAIRAADGFPEVVVFGVVLAGGALAGKTFGYFTGRWIRHNLPGRTLARADRLAGAALGVVGVALLFWVGRPLLALVPGWPSEITRDSVIADAFARQLPAPPAVLRNARRSLSAGVLPQVTDLLNRSVSLGAPPVQTALDAATIGRVRRSVVSIRADACGLTSAGSGFVSAKGEVTTAAHVVAGSSSITVTDDDGRVRAATVRDFDPSLDIARLSVDTAGLGSLPSGDALSGDEVAIFGFPGGKGLRVAGGGVKEGVTVTGRDIYDSRAVERPLLVLAADLDPGDSGAAVVNRVGEVVATAIAIAPDRANTAYAVDVTAVPIRQVPAPGRCVTG